MLYNLEALSFTLTWRTVDLVLTTITSLFKMESIYITPLILQRTLQYFTVFNLQDYASRWNSFLIRDSQILYCFRNHLTLFLYPWHQYPSGHVSELRTWNTRVKNSMYGTNNVDCMTPRARTWANLYLWFDYVFFKLLITIWRLERVNVYYPFCSILKIVYVKSNYVKASANSFKRFTSRLLKLSFSLSMYL